MSDEQVTDQPKTEQPKEQSLIQVDPETQALAPRNHIELVRFIDQMIKAEALPRHLKNREQVLSAWNFAAQMGLPPQPSLRNIAVIEGTPSLFGDLPLALIQKHPDFVFIEEYTINEKYERISLDNKNLGDEVWGGICRLQRKGMKEPQTFAFTKSDAERAGLLRRAKPGMPWHSYPQTMYVRRARAMGGKSLFADAICGANIAEEFGHAPDLKDVTPPSRDRADELNARFAKPVKAEVVEPEAAH